MQLVSFWLPFANQTAASPLAMSMAIGGASAGAPHAEKSKIAEADGHVAQMVSTTPKQLYSHDLGTRQICPYPAGASGLGVVEPSWNASWSRVRRVRLNPDLLWLGTPV